MNPVLRLRKKALQQAYDQAIKRKLVGGGRWAGRAGGRAGGRFGEQQAAPHLLCSRRGRGQGRGQGHGQERQPGAGGQPERRGQSPGLLIAAGCFPGLQPPPRPGRSPREQAASAPLLAASTPALLCAWRKRFWLPRAGGEAEGRPGAQGRRGAAPAGGERVLPPHPQPAGHPAPRQAAEVQGRGRGALGRGAAGAAGAAAAAAAGGARAGRRAAAAAAAAADAGGRAAGLRAAAAAARAAAGLRAAAAAAGAAARCAGAGLCARAAAAWRECTYLLRRWRWRCC